MAKTNIKNLDKFLARMKDAISHFDDKFYLSLGQYVAKRIVSKARTGKTLVGGTEQGLKPLSEDYVEFRESILHGVKEGAKRARKADKKAGGSGKGKHFIKNAKGRVVDDTFFSPKRSNLTLTGQYLKSIRVTFIDKTRRLLCIEPDDKPRKRGPQYIKGSGSVTNKDIAEYQGKQGRNIFGMDQTGLKVMKNMVLAEIRKQLRKNLLRK